MLTNTFLGMTPVRARWMRPPIRPTPPRRQTRDGERGIARSASGSAYRGPRLREHLAASLFGLLGKVGDLSGGSDWSVQIADESGFPDEGRNFPDR